MNPDLELGLGGGGGGDFFVTCLAGFSSFCDSFLLPNIMGGGGVKLFMYEITAMVQCETPEN